MAGIKELRLRIKSVGNIKQITRAMEMVATTKLRRFQDRATASRPYAMEIAGLVGRLAAVIGDEVTERPLFRKPDSKKILALVVASDRGLCGAYNSNLFKSLEDWRAARPDNEIDYFVYGRKGFNYMQKRSFAIKAFLTEPPLESIDYRNATVTARMLTREFLTGEYSEVWFLYSAFESMASYVPTWVRFLPIESASLGGGDEDVGQRLGRGRRVARARRQHRSSTTLVPALPRNAHLQRPARGPDLRIRQPAFRDEERDRRGRPTCRRCFAGIYNRKRQETITKELLDIVGGAAAV